MLSQAVEALELAVRQNPNFPEALQRLAYICGKRLGNLVQADRYRQLAKDASRRIKEIRSGDPSLMAMTRSDEPEALASDMLAAKYFYYDNNFTSTSGSVSKTVDYSRSFGNFLGKKGYLGVRFRIDANIHYGWIRFIADEDAKNGRVVDWAYEDQPDTPITTGAGIFDWNLFWPAMMGRNRTAP